MASYNPPDGGKVDIDMDMDMASWPPIIPPDGGKVDIVGKRSLKSQVRFVLWTGDDTVHCDDAYSDKNTVSKSRPNDQEMKYHEDELCFQKYDQGD